MDNEEKLDNTGIMADDAGENVAVPEEDVIVVDGTEEEVTVEEGDFYKKLDRAGLVDFAKKKVKENDELRHEINVLKIRLTRARSNGVPRGMGR